MATSRVGLLFLLMLAGCGPKAQLREDPFAQPPAARRERQDKGNATRDPDAPVLPDIERNSIASKRSAWSDGDPFLGAAVPAANGSDPQSVVRGALDSGVQTSGQAAGTLDAAAQDAVRYRQDLRRRLDRIGAQHLQLDTDPETKATFVHVEVPNPRDPMKSQVFESRGDELKAILAVTEAAENWYSQQRQ